ncbi:hypothetical protein ACFY3V_10220 [Streptosporangium sp. NPDC000095]
MRNAPLEVATAGVYDGDHRPAASEQPVCLLDPRRAQVPEAAGN